MLDDLATAGWRKSTRSSGEAACVEVAQLASDHHAVRDSKNPHGGHLRSVGGVRHRNPRRAVRLTTPWLGTSGWREARGTQIGWQQSTFWGDPARYNDRIHSAGALHLHTVGSAAEARMAVGAGVDLIVAQGFEAGGHVWGKVQTMVLVPAVVDVAEGVPVIAAGGIADGRGLAAALMLGAQAARFLTAREAFTHEEYRRQVIAAEETDAVHTLAFDGGWPAAAHRALRNTTLTAWEAAGRPAAPDRPGENDVIAWDGNGGEQLRYGDMMPLPGMTGDVEAMAMYAGQSAGLVHDVKPAAQIVSDIADQARKLLNTPRCL